MSSPDKAHYREPALIECVRIGLFPPPWFVPIEAPACGMTIDGLATPLASPGDPRPRFTCDRQAGHDGNHRQVTDNDNGRAVEWTYCEADNA